jgi:hypothetical protein
MMLMMMIFKFDIEVVGVFICKFCLGVFFDVIVCVIPTIHAVELSSCYNFS